MRKLFYSLGVVLMLVSCNNASSDGTDDSKTTGSEALLTEVMAVHDEVMPKKGDIGSLMTILKKMETTTTEDSLNVMKAYSALKEADNGMMTWMREFKNPKEQGWNEEKKFTYLTDQQVKVNKVAVDINEALAVSNNVIASINEKAGK